MGQDCGELKLSETEAAAYSSFSRQGASSLSYSDFVAAVDYVLDPARLMEQEGDVRGLPRGPSDLDQYWLFRLRELPSLHAWAAQNNDDPFQQKAMTSWWLWHQRAIDAAVHGDHSDAAEEGAGRRNLYAGLLMNAIGNHYLQDFFVPGHVTTPREGLQDYAALSMHDLYNREGALYQLPAEPLRSTLLSLVDVGLAAAALGFEADELEADLANPKGRDTILLRGDGYLLPSPHKLARNPSLGRESRQQVLFMGVVLARSLLDVFQSVSSRRSPRLGLGETRDSA